ncbi:MAG: hypothetical protein HUU10_12875 [Bacteroidetes bacterium]|nr:hypothetical protein [Bacteroidota bacterium]
MNLHAYLYTQFLSDLTSIHFKQPNHLIMEHPEEWRIDSATVFFGGPDWENMETDLRWVDKENLDNFILCLFVITVIDLTMFSHFRSHYPVFRVQTRYPKFGWAGFGLHYEKPKKLLTVPVQAGLTTLTKTPDEVKELVNLFIWECDRFFGTHLPPITTTAFVEAMLADRDFRPEEGDTSLFLQIYTELKSRID